MTEKQYKLSEAFWRTLLAVTKFSQSIRLVYLWSYCNLLSIQTYPSFQDWGGGQCGELPQTWLEASPPGYCQSDSVLWVLWLDLGFLAHPQTSLYFCQLLFRHFCQEPWSVLKYHQPDLQLPNGWQFPSRTLLLQAPCLYDMQNSNQNHAYMYRPKFASTTIRWTVCLCVRDQDLQAADTEFGCCWLNAERCDLEMAFEM